MEIEPTFYHVLVLASSGNAVPVVQAGLLTTVREARASEKMTLRRRQ